MAGDENNFFEQLFDHTQSLVALYRPEAGKFVQVNRFGINMFETRDSDELITQFESGGIWPDPPNDLSAYLAEIQSAVQVQGFLEREIQCQTATGKTFWGLLRIDSLKVNEEKHLLIKITNIDNLKKASLTSLENAHQLQALFNNSTIGIVITNSKGKIIDFNQFAEKQFGYDKAEIVGQPVELLIPQQFRDRHQTYRNNFGQHPQDRTMGAGRDLYARRKDNSEFPVEVSLNHYRLAGEHFVIAFVVDISIRKRDEIQLLQQKQKLEVVSAQVQAMNTELERKVEARTNMLKETLSELEASKEELREALEKERDLGELKSRFVTMASHEFRTPLSAILTSSYIIQQYTSSEDQDRRDRHLVKIQNAVQNLTFILEDFLSLGKLEEGQVQVKPQEITPPELVAEIESIAEEMKNILKKGQHIEFKYAFLPSIITDKNLLRNILVNLISNAIKYSTEQAPICIDALGENGHLKISVIDHGIGIPEADQKHLFERFFRAANVSTTQGTGLGLHIVNRYLKLIQGDISMKSEVNKGTTFTIVLNNALEQ